MTELLRVTRRLIVFKPNILREKNKNTDIKASPGLQEAVKAMMKPL